jgi:hypothetical protein
MLSTFRDPLRTVFDDWSGIEPWGLGTEILPLSSGGLGTSSGGRGRVRSGRLMTVDAFEDQNEFKVICEVRSKCFLYLSLYPHLTSSFRFLAYPRTNSMSMSRTIS